MSYQVEYISNYLILNKKWECTGLISKKLVKDSIM